MPVSSHLDWVRVAEIVDRHDVGALVHRSGWAGDHGAPPWLQDRLARRARETAQAVLSCLSVQRAVVEGLEAAEVQVVVLKGSGLAIDAHADVALRPSRDIDVLVAAESVEDAARALEGRGVSWQGLGLDDDDGRSMLAHADRLPLLKNADFACSGIVVELHWRLTANRHLMPVLRAWLEDPRRIDVAGMSTPVLPLVAAWWHVLVHGTTHDWRRLGWLADVAAMARRHPELTSVAALRAGGDTGLDRCAATGLLVCERVLGPFLEADARAWARAVRGTAPLVRSSLAALASGDAGSSEGVSPAGLARHAATRLALRGDVRYRAEEVRRLLLDAARAHTVADPGIRVMARGPARWLARYAPVLGRAAPDPPD